MDSQLLWILVLNLAALAVGMPLAYHLGRRWADRESPIPFPEDWGERPNERRQTEEELLREIDRRNPPFDPNRLHSATGTNPSSLATSSPLSSRGLDGRLSYSKLLSMLHGVKAAGGPERSGTTDVALGFSRSAARVLVGRDGSPTSVWTNPGGVTPSPTAASPGPSGSTAEASDSGRASRDAICAGPAKWLCTIGLGHVCGRGR